MDGLGLGMFLSYQVAPLRKNGRLKYVLEQFEPEPIPVHVVYAHAKYAIDGHSEWQWQSSNMDGKEAGPRG
jgi:hypothetical protein